MHIIGDFIEKEAKRLGEMIAKDAKNDNAIWKIGNMQQGLAQLKNQVVPIRRRTLFYENGKTLIRLEKDLREAFSRKSLKSPYQLIFTTHPHNMHYLNYHPCTCSAIMVLTVKVCSR